MELATVAETLSFAALPEIGAPLEHGTFAGVVTKDDGTHAAVVLLSDRKQDVNWQDASDWAKSLNAQLPTRLAALSVFKHLKAKAALPDRWHWTCETLVDEDDPEDASSAWNCTFYYGLQHDNRKSCEGCAVAVRLIPLSA